MFNTSFAGHSLTTVDMDANKVEGIHFGYLLPLSQINNYSSWKMPWLWGPKLIELHRFYASLKSRLIPYLYSCMYQATQNGIPFLLPPALEFPQDPECRRLLHEHLLGPSLLVTSFTREIYFPEGEWKDYWTGQYVGGKKYAPVSWPENRGGGLFIRKGAIIPMGPVMQYRLAREVDEVELYCYPSEQETRFAYYEDDGVSLDYQQGKYALSDITLKGDEKSVTLTLEPHSDTRVRQWSAVIAAKSAPCSVTSGGKAIPFTWDEERQEIHISNIVNGITEIKF
jgi:alpha-glucosidase (family GH31 glycosyl hydrolase)